MTTRFFPRTTRGAAVFAIGAWLLLAFVVFNVRFDWQTRAANNLFVQSQLARQAHGLPVLTIHDGFRPMVRAAAREAAVWMAVIAIAGSAATLAAARPRHSAR